MLLVSSKAKYLTTVFRSLRRKRDYLEPAPPDSIRGRRITQGKEIVLQFLEAAPFQIDGELSPPTTAIKVQAVPGAITVKVPH